MYGLPADFDAAFFVGKRLEMVCINANQIYLHFSGDTTITIEAEYSVHQGDFEPERHAVPTLAPLTLTLLEHAVVSAQGDPGGTLTIAFDNGVVVRCFDSSRQYESYRILNDGKTTIV